MSPLAEALAVASITLLAVISPGPDFAMVTRNSYLFGRRTGLLCALGIALGVQVHVCYTMFGVAMLIEHAHGWLTAVKLLGAAYLIWIGIKTLTQPHAADGGYTRGAQASSNWASLRMGFLTNALNPKTTLFVVSTYTQVVDAHTPWAVATGPRAVHVRGALGVVQPRGVGVRRGAAARCHAAPAGFDRQDARRGAVRARGGAGAQQPGALAASG